MKSKTNNDCEWFEERIEDFIDQDLLPEESSDFLNHRSGCSRCAHELQAAQRVKASLESRSLLECPEDIVNRILSEVAKSPHSDSFPTAEQSARGFWSTWLGWTAVAVPVVVFALVFFLASPPIPRPMQLTVAEPEFTNQEIKEAEHQLKVTMAYLGQVGMKGVALAGREVIEEGIIVPAEKTIVAMLDTKALSLGRGKTGEAAR